MKLSVTPKHIIGITGAFGSGKTTAAKFFSKNGYELATLSSILEKVAEERGLPLTRKVLQDIGNEMREEAGIGILMEKVLANNLSKKLVIDGLRNLGEVLELKKNKNSTLLAIVADKKVRFDRLKNLKRREQLTPDIFNKLDMRDLGVNEKVTGLQTALCIALSDVFIDSNGGVKDFEKDLTKFLKNHG